MNDDDADDVEERTRDEPKSAPILTPAGDPESMKKRRHGAKVRVTASSGSDDQMSRLDHASCKTSDGMTLLQDQNTGKVLQQGRRRKRLIDYK